MRSLAVGRPHERGGSYSTLLRYAHRASPPPTPPPPQVREVVKARTAAVNAAYNVARELVEVRGGGEGGGGDL